MKEWILIKDLIGMEELANTPQGIAQRAKKENWQRRRVAGQKGNVFEYYVGDMPESVQRALDFTQRDPTEASEPTTAYQTKPNVETGEILVNKQRLITAISTLEEILEITHKTMKPEAKAQMVLMIYELLSEESANEKIIEMIKLVA